MKNNLVKLPVKYNAKRKVRGAVKKQTVIEFPAQSFIPASNSEKFFIGEIIGTYLQDLGINEGDDVEINTYEAVGNGDLIVLEQNESHSIGLAKFIGGGKVRLDYIHSTETFELSEVKIIGRVVRSFRNWE